LPEQRREAAELRAQTAAAALAEKTANDAERNERLNQGKAANTGAATRPVDAAINKEYTPDTMPEGTDPQKYARTAEVDRALRYPTEAGGAGLSGPLAKFNASEFMKGNLTLKQVTDANGTSAYKLVDKDGTSHGYLSSDMGDRILHLSGSQKIGGGGQGGGGQGGIDRRASVVGAGGSNPMVAMQGLNQNLAGVPTQQLPPQQATA
jgi:hypothetical protein